MPIDDEILQRLCENNSTLTSLDLDFNKIDAAGASALGEAIQKNTILTSLDLRNNQIGNAGAQALAKGLEKNTSLTSLGLRNNQIGDAGTSAFGEAIQKNITLTSLDLSDNQVGVIGAQALAAGLERSTTLTSLDLESNQIGAAGAQALAKGLKKNTTLTSLDLNDNQIGDAGASALGEALLYNSTLTLLVLWENQLSRGIQTQINNLIKRNQHYLSDLQIEVCKQLKIARMMLCKTESTNSGINPYLGLPLEIKEKIVMHVNEHLVFTREQQRLLLNYVEGKIAPVADKLSFFKVTKCDRVRKQFNQDEGEAGYSTFNSIS